MIMDAEVFIEHYGKKGMRWGVKKAKRGDWKGRSAGQKTGLVVGGYVGATVGSAIGQQIAIKLIKKGKLGAGVGVSLASIGVGAVVGTRLTRNILQKNGKKPYKKFEKALMKDEDFDF